MTRNVPSLTNSLMQVFAREMKKQADISLYGADYETVRAQVGAMVTVAVLKAKPLKPRDRKKA